jgi:hypothetical protein
MCAELRSDPGRRGLGLLFLFFLAWPVVLVDTSGTSMSDSVLLATIRLVDDGTWTLSDRSDPMIVHRTRAFDVSFHDLRVYSGVGPGASVVAAPFYFFFRPVFSLFDDGVVANRRILNYYMRNSRAIGEEPSGHFKDLYLLQILLVWCLVAPLFAIFLTRFHLLLTDHGCDPVQATVIAVATGLGSMALYYSSMYSRQALAYLLLWHAILSLARRAEPSQKTCIAAGLLCGTAVSIDYSSAMLAGLGLLFVLSRLVWPARILVVFPFVAVLGLTALYHELCFGSPLATPYHHRFWFTPRPLAERGLDFSLFEQGRFIGMNLPSARVMVQLCFGPFKGLFVYSPILLLGLIGHFVGLRTGPRRGWHLLSLIVFVTYLTFNSTMGTHLPDHGHHIWGGQSVLWGPRHLFAVLPFLAYGLSRLDWRRAWVRLTCGGLLLVSVVFNVLGTMFSHVMMRTDAFGPELRFPLGYALTLFAGRGPRITLLDSYDVNPFAQIVVFLALVLLSIALLCAILRRDPDRGTAPGMNEHV